MIYFREVLENIRVHEDFDVYGHLDYVARYGGYAEKKCTMRNLPIYSMKFSVR